MFEQALQQVEQRRKRIQRAERQYEREAFARWSSGVIQHAEKAGVTTPTSAELSMLKRLAEMESPFSAAQVVRNGWCGVRTTAQATKTLERFVSNGWIHPALPNREGHPRYAFTREHALGATGPVTVWPELDPAFMLLEAEFLTVSNDTDKVEEDAVAECGFEGVPDPSAEGELWNMARNLAFEDGTNLHKIAGCIEGLTPIQRAYAMTIAKCRADGDPIRTHLRGIAEYLSVDYNALCAGVRVAEAAIRILNEIETEKRRRGSKDNLATPMPTIEI